MVQHVPNSHRQSRLFGYLLLLLGGLSAAAGGLAAIVGSHWPGWSGFVALGLGGGAFWASAYLIWVGRRHVVRSAGEMLATDARRPIVYLRSFDQEERLAPGEEALAELFSEAGPVIAIGRPADRLPPLGAFRHYVEQDGAAWQQYIDDALPKAGLVLLALGRTAGLAWELERCLKVLSPERFALLVSEPLDVRPEAGGAVVGGLPGVVAITGASGDAHARVSVGPWHGIVVFDRNWHASYRPFARPAGPDYAGYSTSDVRGALSASDIARHTFSAALTEVPDARPSPLEKRRRLVRNYDVPGLGGVDGALLWFLVNGIRLGLVTSSLATRLALLFAGLVIAGAIGGIVYLALSTECKIDCVVLDK